MRLELVRELLRLDRQYYSATDQHVLQETIHRLKVAGKQLIERPTLLLEVVKKRKLSALWIPDRKRILLDRELPDAKVRWAEAHEITHGIIPWHAPMAHGDEKRTLSLACEERLEAEANFGAGRLLFLQDRFVEALLGSELTLKHVFALSEKFGNTKTSTLWRSIEGTSLIAFGLVSQHPRSDQVKLNEPLVRYFIRSRGFEKQFASVSDIELYNVLRRLCWGKRGPLGDGAFELVDVRGDVSTFHVECFWNGHDALSLGRLVKSKSSGAGLPRAVIG